MRKLTNLYHSYAGLFAEAEFQLDPKVIYLIATNNSSAVDAAQSLAHLAQHAVYFQVEHISCTGRTHAYAKQLIEQYSTGERLTDEFVEALMLAYFDRLNCEVFEDPSVPIFKEADEVVHNIVTFYDHSMLLNMEATTLRACYFLLGALRKVTLTWMTEEENEKMRQFLETILTLAAPHSSHRQMVLDVLLPSMINGWAGCSPANSTAMMELVLQLVDEHGFSMYPELLNIRYSRTQDNERIIHVCLQQLQQPNISEELKCCHMKTMFNKQYVIKEQQDSQVLSLAVSGLITQEMEREILLVPSRVKFVNAKSTIKIFVDMISAPVQQLTVSYSERLIEALLVNRPEQVVPWIIENCITVFQANGDAKTKAQALWAASKIDFAKYTPGRVNEVVDFVIDSIARQEPECRILKDESKIELVDERQLVQFAACKAATALIKNIVTAKKHHNMMRQIIAGCINAESSQPLVRMAMSTIGTWMIEPYSGPLECLPHLYAAMRSCPCCYEIIFADPELLCNSLVLIPETNREEVLLELKKLVVHMSKASILDCCKLIEELAKHDSRIIPYLTKQLIMPVVSDSRVVPRTRDAVHTTMVKCLLVMSMEDAQQFLVEPIFRYLMPLVSTHNFTSKIGDHLFLYSTLMAHEGYQQKYPWLARNISTLHKLALRETLKPTSNSTLAEVCLANILQELSTAEALQTIQQVFNVIQRCDQGGMLFAYSAISAPRFIASVTPGLFHYFNEISYRKCKHFSTYKMLSGLWNMIRFNSEEGSGFFYVSHEQYIRHQQLYNSGFTGDDESNVHNVMKAIGIALSFNEISTSKGQYLTAIILLHFKKTMPQAQWDLVLKRRQKVFVTMHLAMLPFMKPTTKLADTTIQFR